MPQSTQEKFFDAAVSGDSRAVSRLLSSPAPPDVNAAGPGGSSALAWTAFNGSGPMVRLLLAAGADPNNAGSDGGQTPLMCAAWRGWTGVVSLLLAAPRIDVNVKNKYGHTAFYYAVINNEVDVLALLFAHKSATQPLDTSIRGPSAVWDENIDLIRPLGISETTIQTIEDGIAARNIPVSEKWWSRPLSHTDPNSLLRRACLDASASNYATIGELVNSGADPNAANEDGVTAFMAACWMWRLDAVRLFLSRGGMDVNKRDKLGRTAYYYAAASNAVDVLDVLNHPGWRVNITLGDRWGRLPQVAAVEDLNEATPDKGELLVLEGLDERHERQRGRKNRFGIRKSTGSKDKENQRKQAGDITKPKKAKGTATGGIKSRAALMAQTTIAQRAEPVPVPVVAIPEPAPQVIAFPEPEPPQVIVILDSDPPQAAAMEIDDHPVFGNHVDAPELPILPPLPAPEHTAPDNTTTDTDNWSFEEAKANLMKDLAALEALLAR